MKKDLFIPRKSTGEIHRSLIRKVLHSVEGEYRLLKGVLGFLCGLFVGGILYFLLVFTFNFGYFVALWITVGNTIIICIGLAASMWFRCVLLLMLPNIVTGRGRVTLLAVMFGILLSGPVMNIEENASEISESMACTAELIYNQSLMLRHQLEEPVRDLALKIRNSMEDVRKAGQELQEGLKPVTAALGDLRDKVKEASMALKVAVQQCEKEANTVRIKCVNGINSAKSRCEEELDRIDPTDDVIDFGQDTKDFFENAFDFGRRRRSASCQRIWPWQESYTSVKIESVNKRRSKRAILSNVCSALDVSALCDAVQVGSAYCQVLVGIGDLATGVVFESTKLLDSLTNFFVFGIESNQDLEGKINSSQTAAQILMNVQADISRKIESINGILEVLRYILAVPLIFLFIRSCMYVRKYRTKDYFDNNYISEGFKQYDQSRKAKGKPSVLPLKKKEKRKYIDTRSKLLSPMELRMSKAGGINVILHFLSSGVVILADYVLYYVLTVVQRYGSINVSVSGSTSVVIDIMGSGLVAKVLRSLVNGVMIESDFDVDFEISKCLPNPKQPEVRTVFILFTLYLVAFVFVLTQAYGLRLRRKIAAFFYPTQEFERIMYLHEKIRLKRKSIIAWLRQNMKSRRKQNAVTDTVTLSALFYYRCPKLASYMDSCKPKAISCLSCSETYNGVTEFHICTTSGCDGVYCINCFVEMEKQCAICKTL